LLEDWQIGFVVKGLRAPSEVFINDNILIKGTPHDDAYVFLKSSIHDEEEQDEFREKMTLFLRELMATYGFVNNVHTEILGGTIMGKITSENPFGYAKYPPNTITMIAMPTEKQRRDNVPILKRTIEIYDCVKKSQAEKGFLRNAIDYYYRSLGDLRLEEKLIDLMIAFESMFSGGRNAGELRLRYALRASFFLSIGQETKRSTIFKDVYDLYNKRSAVVHGTGGVKLDSAEISVFQKHVREAIKRFINIEKPKDDVLILLDKSVYDEDERELLNQIVSSAKP
jgi:hypothetical protein